MPKRDLTAIAQGSSADLQPIQRGRGLSSLLSARSGVALENARRLPLDVIDINPHQARQSFDEGTLAELAESIRLHDVLQPIGVRPNGERYEILFGERRYRAALIAGKVDIPSVVYEDLADAEAAILTALENLQREDLDIEDEARQFAYLLQVTGLSQRKLAEKLGVQFNYLSRRVRLLKRPDLMEEYRLGRKTLHGVMAMLDAGTAPGEGGGEMEDDKTRNGEDDGVSGAGEIGDKRFVSTGSTVSAGYSLDDDEGAEPDFELIERADLPGFIVSRGYSAHTGSGEASPPNGGRPGNTGRRSSIRFRWRPVQQFYNWVGRTQVADVPADERATLKVQLTEIKEALEQQIAQLEQLQDDGGSSAGTEISTALLESGVESEGAGKLN